MRTSLVCLGNSPAHLFLLPNEIPFLDPPSSIPNSKSKQTKNTWFYAGIFSCVSWGGLGIEPRIRNSAVQKETDVSFQLAQYLKSRVPHLPFDATPYYFLSRRSLDSLRICILICFLFLSSIYLRMLGLLDVFRTIDWEKAKEGLELLTCRVLTGLPREL